MEKGLYKVLVNEFECMAENANDDEEEVYSEEGIKKTLEWLKDNDEALYQVIDDCLVEAYRIVNGEDE